MKIETENVRRVGKGWEIEGEKKDIDKKIEWEEVERLKERNKEIKKMKE